MRKLTTLAVAAAVATAVAMIAIASASGAAPTKPPVVSIPPSGPATSVVAASSLPAEDSYVPIMPCRVVDTRLAGGPLANLAARSFYVRGTANFPGQGGTSGGCHVPTSAAGVTTNVTIAGATGNGYMAGYPTGTPEPTTNFVTFSQTATVTTNPSFALASAGVTPDLTIRNPGAPAQVVMDVTGYYAPPMEGMISTKGAIFAGTSRLVSTTRVGPGHYTATFDRSVYYCSPTATPYNPGVGTYASATAYSGNTINVYTWYVDSSTHLAVPYDYYVNISVIC